MSQTCAIDVAADKLAVRLHVSVSHYISGESATVNLKESAVGHTEFPSHACRAVALIRFTVVVSTVRTSVIASLVVV